tara:strand:- start:41 stop:391 length:351 start_codon:yes stop_codon:yes gene_type:complete
MWFDILKVRLKVNLQVLEKALENWSINHRDRAYSTMEIVDDIADEVARGTVYKWGIKHGSKQTQHLIHHLKRKMEEPSYLINAGMSQILRHIGYVNKQRTFRGRKSNVWEYIGEEE